ncbi:MAG: tetratricopeptide repeat protein [Candidatus Solibacter usitatus]|nr:tetratricopeptide repeat protein [Candidatus Solibacter usitatus]
MRRAAGLIVLSLCCALAPAAITIDYPAQGSIFPPEITPPTFLWRDAAPAATEWRIDVQFADGAAGIQAVTKGERLRLGETDPRCVSDTNRPPQLTPEQAAGHAWAPDGAKWAEIKRRSVERPATIVITGLAHGAPVSHGQVTIRTSKDPVGAPIFYRDVPLMPSETEKGVIKPLASEAVRLINWRLRDVSEPASRVVLENMPTCGNCHSFSLDGKTMGMDLDGPQNHKGMYTLTSVKPEMSISNEDVIEWSSARGRLEGKLRVGFMSQVSPDGRYVLTTINGAAADPKTAADPPTNYYVANFTDYRFLQVFYPTRGILAWYSRATGLLQPLSGADDPRFVQASAVWSPDGSYVVFARAEAKDPAPAGKPLAVRANDSNEVQVRYDLYRVPFNGGRGGRAEPIQGASQNGMSNSFAKVSPDGRWIVFVQARNGQLMRPDGKLYIVPAAGGAARLMNCNTPLMNSWHSFSPNGRWMVFSSKSRSPYTQMYVTHIDEQGNDSPAILIDNATVANRAVNIPEFVNIPRGGLNRIEVPAVEYYRLFDSALALQQQGELAKAAGAWAKVLEAAPEDAGARNNFGLVLFQAGRLEEAAAQFRKAAAIRPRFVQAHCALGSTLAMQGRREEAVGVFRGALAIDAEYAPAHNDLGMALLQEGNAAEALPHFRKAVALKPGFAAARCNLGTTLALQGHVQEAIAELRQALEYDPSHAPAHFNLGLALARSGQTAQAIGEWRATLKLQPNHLEALNQAAWALATSPEAAARNGSEAVALAERAYALSAGKDAGIVDTLAAAYAEAGRYAEAAQTARTAMSLASRQSRAAQAAMKARVALYESNRPYREPAKRQRQEP